MKIIEGQQYGDLWWSIRRGRPSASEFKKFITAVKGEWAKPATDYACRLIADFHDLDYPRVDSHVSAAMKNGTDSEPVARAAYELTRDSEVKEVCICLTDDGKACSSPDGLVGSDGVLELKCPESYAHLRYLAFPGELAMDYRQQTHGHLVVTGYDWCDLFSFCPPFPPLLVRIVPDEYTEKLRKALARFVDLKDEIADRLDLPKPDRDPVSEDDHAF